MTSTAVLGVLLGALLGAAVLLLVVLVAGWTPRRSRPTPTGAKVSRGPVHRRRVVWALITTLAVLVTTRWPTAGLAAGALVLLWPRMFGAGTDAAAQLTRIEALATWTESLRDSIAGSIGLDQAITHSVRSAPVVLQVPLQRLDGRLRAHVPLTQALRGFADDLDDPSADLVLAALILNASLRGPGLVATLSALSVAAREELDLRRRVEEGRKALRRTASVIIGVTVAFAGSIAVVSREYVAPYATPAGQLALAVVLGVFGTGLVWVRNAANVAPPNRFLTAQPQVGVTTEPARSTSSGRGDATR